MNDVIIMEVAQCQDNTSDEEFGLVLRESPPQSNVVSKIPSIKEVHDQEQVLLVLEGVGHVH